MVAQLIYGLWLAKGVAVLQSAIVPSWTLRTPRPVEVLEPLAAARPTSRPATA